MRDEHLPDELDEYLRGASPLSRQYQRESAPVPPHALERLVLDAARPQQVESKPSLKSQSLAPLAFAASVLLSVALVLAIVVGPAVRRTDDKPYMVQVRAYKADQPSLAVVSPRKRNPAAWLADISALRRAGRNGEAELEMRRFRSAYPDYIIPIRE
jgi:hypothetical protein